MASYYSNKIDLLQDIFQAESVSLGSDSVTIDERKYKIVNDVIVVLEAPYLPDQRGGGNSSSLIPRHKNKEFSTNIQSTFGQEWNAFPDILPEHSQEFEQYFDIVDLESLKGKRIADLGCGIGRWSFFLKEIASEMILVDFSNAIFVARRNLSDTDNTIFIMGDVLDLPFRKDFADFAFCVGVAHHLPVDALQVVRKIACYARQSLFYLYSALDNHPIHYKFMMAPVNLLRGFVSKFSNEIFRTTFSFLATLLLYFPLIGIGYLVHPIGLSKFVPLFDFYAGKSMKRIRQDAYDRFFTSIEQRVSRKQIMTLRNNFSKITISPNIPFWHFLIER